MASVTTVAGLQALLRSRRSTLRPGHVALMFYHAVRLVDRQNTNMLEYCELQAVLSDMASALAPRLSTLTSRELLHMMAGMAKLRFRPGLSFLEACLQASLDKLSSCRPEQLAMYLTAVSRMDYLPLQTRSCPTFTAWLHTLLVEAKTRMALFSPLDLSRLLGGLAALHYTPPPGWSAAFQAALLARLHDADPRVLTQCMASLAALDVRPSKEFMRAYYTEVYYKLPLFDSSDLSTSLTAFVSLKRMLKVDFLADFLAEVADKLPTFLPGHLASLLHALAALRRDMAPPPPALLAAMGAQVEVLMWRFSPAHLCCAVWGLAALGYRPSPAFLELMYNASYTKLRSTTPADVTLLLVGLADMCVAAPQGAGGGGSAPAAQRWWDRVLLRLESSYLRPDEVADVLDALARLGVSPDPALLQQLELQVCRNGLRQVGAPRVARLLVAMAALHMRPAPHTLSRALATVRFYWTSLPPADLVACMAALVALRAHLGAGVKEKKDLAAVLLQCRLLTQRLEAADVARLLPALAALPQRFRPSRQWLAELTGVTQKVWDGLGEEGFAVAVSCLQRLGAQPHESWRAGLQQQVLLRVPQLSQRQVKLLRVSITRWGWPLPPGVRYHEGLFHTDAAVGTDHVASGTGDTTHSDVDGASSNIYEASNNVDEASVNIEAASNDVDEASVNIEAASSDVDEASMVSIVSVGAHTGVKIDSSGSGAVAPATLEILRPPAGHSKRQAAHSLHDTPSNAGASSSSSKADAACAVAAARDNTEASSSHGTACSSPSAASGNMDATCCSGAASSQAAAVDCVDAASGCAGDVGGADAALLVGAACSNADATGGMPNSASRNADGEDEPSEPAAWRQARGASRAPLQLPSSRAGLHVAPLRETAGVQEGESVAQQESSHLESRSMAKAESSGRAAGSASALPGQAAGQPPGGEEGGPVIAIAGADRRETRSGEQQHRHAWPQGIESVKGEWGQGEAGQGGGWPQRKESRRGCAGEETGWRVEEGVCGGAAKPAEWPSGQQLGGVASGKSYQQEGQYSNGAGTAEGPDKGSGCCQAGDLRVQDDGHGEVGQMSEMPPTPSPWADVVPPLTASGARTTSDATLHDGAQMKADMTATSTLHDGAQVKADAVSLQQCSGEEQAGAIFPLVLGQRLHNYRQTHQ